MNDRRLDRTLLVWFALATLLTPAVSFAQAPNPPTVSHGPDAPQTESTRARTTSPRRYSDALAAASFAGEVVVAEVRGRMGTMGAGAEAIFSDVVLEVRDAVVDQGGYRQAGTIALSLLGGEVDGKGMTTSHGVTMHVGDTLLVVVTDPLASSPTYRGRPGVLQVIDGRVFTYSGHPVLEIRPTGPFSARPCQALPTSTAPTPKGTASGRVLSAECANPSDALTRDEVLGIWADLVADGQKVSK